MTEKKHKKVFLLQKVASIIVATTVILGALSLAGSTVFLKKEEGKDLENRINAMEKDQVRVITKLDNIQNTVQEIKEAVKNK